MKTGLIIRIVDPQDDYLGIEIRAANSRFAGSAQFYAGLTELSEFATEITGFPVNAEDERLFEFGSRDAGVAGGYGRFRFHCIDQAGHAAIEVAIEDEWHPSGEAHFSLMVEAADIDRFISRLHEVERERAGEAALAVGS
jgi:hypothetical protein